MLNEKKVFLQPAQGRPDEGRTERCSHCHHEVAGEIGIYLHSVKDITINRIIKQSQNAQQL